MERMTDGEYLAGQQYASGANLSARRHLHERWSESAVDWHEWLFARLPEDPGDLLELAGGTGELWAVNRGRIPENWSLTLTDVSVGMVDEMRQRLGDRPRTEFHQADARELPFESDSFDTVVMNHALYHVDDRPSALAEIRRVLRRGGTLVAATNGPAHMFELDLLAAPVLGTPTEDPGVGFGLLSGYPQLLAHFDKVVVERFPDSIVARGTEGVEDVYAYVASTLESPEPDAMAELRVAIEARVANGGFRITKDVGVFTAFA